MTTMVDLDALDLDVDRPEVRGLPAPGTSSTATPSRVSSRRDARAVARAVVAALPAVLAVSAAWFLLYGFLLSGVAQRVSQSRLYDEFRLELASETAPLAEPVPAGSPVAMINALIDLMAAVPSVIYGAWGFFLLMPHASLTSRWISQYFGWIPIFHVDTDPSAAVWAQSRFVNSAFIAGLCVSLMVIPIACSVMRGVFAEAPLGEREAAFALGGTKWGMIRSVVLPFGRGGIIGGTMLGLGRALGETIAVLFIISLTFKVNFRILENGTSTISALIANDFGESTSAQLAALLTAGLVLFILTLGVNTVAAVFITRSRSGAATEI